MLTFLQRRREKQKLSERHVGAGQMIYGPSRMVKREDSALAYVVWADYLHAS